MPVFFLVPVGVNQPSHINQTGIRRVLFLAAALLSIKRGYRVGRSLETVGVSPHHGGSDPPDQNLRTLERV